MIEIVNVRKLKAIAKDPSVTACAIVRSMTYPIAGVEQLDVLSPSKNLFFWYRDMAKRSMWNRDAFDGEYVSRFLEEIRSSQSARRALTDLWIRSRDGEHIVLGCYCADETMCHRSIIAGLLSGTGAEVRTETGNDYSIYYEQYHSISKQF